MKVQLEDKKGVLTDIAQPIPVVSGKFTKALCALIDRYRESGYYDMTYHCELTEDELGQIVGPDLTSYAQHALTTKMSKGSFQWKDGRRFSYRETIPG